MALAAPANDTKAGMTREAAIAVLAAEFPPAHVEGRINKQYTNFWF